MLLLSLSKFALKLISIFVCECTLSMRSSIVKVSNIHRLVIVVVFSLACWSTIEEITLIPFAILVDHSSITIHSIFLPITFIQSAITENLSAETLTIFSLLGQLSIVPGSISNFYHRAEEDVS